ncbi:hypothetical protein B6D25_02250, partial [Micrococcus luteus]
MNAAPEIQDTPSGGGSRTGPGQSVPWQDGAPLRPALPPRVLPPPPRRPPPPPPAAEAPDGRGRPRPPPRPPGPPRPCAPCTPCGWGWPRRSAPASASSARTCA